MNKHNMNQGNTVKHNVDLQHITGHSVYLDDTMEHDEVSGPLARYFPMLRSRWEVLKLIAASPALNEQFQSWKPEQQEEFLDVCTGAKGLKVIYDGVFKEIFNPETTPERLEELLSLILRRKVKIKAVLPNDSVRLGAESALLYTDIIVELEDGSLCDVEIQKIGYAFPGQRSACYSADHLLRQYKRVRGVKGKYFTYRDIKKVCTIVFCEQSAKEFQKYPKDYIHWFRQQSNTGLEIDMLQEYCYICLDIFKKNIENRSVKTDIEAWLAFLSYDEPQRILELIAHDEKFEAMYRDIYEMCLNMERVVDVFSKELAILDRNTVRYMMDEMQAEIDQMKEEANQKHDELNRLKEEASQKSDELNRLKEEMSQKSDELNRLKEETNQLKEETNQKDEMIKHLRAELSAMQK